MRFISLAKAISAATAGVGLALAVGAAVLGQDLPYRDWVIVAGVDALAIGAAAYVLMVIFSGKPASAPARTKPHVRSLDSADGQELKRMLVQYISSEKPVTISYPADDQEAEQFAAQISELLHTNGFKVVGFAAAPPTERFDPGIGIDDGNHILVGPIGARGSAAPAAAPAAPPEQWSPATPPAEALQASGMNSP